MESSNKDKAPRYTYMIRTNLESFEAFRKLESKFHTQGLEEGMRWLEASNKDKARGWVGFNVPFSHRLTAAADIILMPSRFEPCGLNQVCHLSCLGVC